MPLPEFHRFLRPTLDLMMDGSPRHWRDIEDHVADAWQLPSDEREELVPSGNRTRLSDRVQWAITYLRQAKLVERAGRGVTRITPRGVEFASQAPIDLGPSDLTEFPEFVEFQQRSKVTPTANEPNVPEMTIVVDSSMTPEESIDLSYRNHKSALADEVLEQVKGISPARFEYLIVRLMLQLGYGGAGDESGKTLGRSGDGGVDGVIKQDKLGLENIYLQAKRWTNGSVSRQEVQAFVGALSGQGASKGVFITTTGFTKEAVEYAKNNKSFKLSLIDGLTLAQLMIDNGLGVSLVQRYDVKRIDSDFFTLE